VLTSRSQGEVTMLISRRCIKNFTLAGLTSGVLLILASGMWLHAQPRPYPRSVQFSAPHQGILFAAIDAAWFRPYNPPIFESLPKSWIPTVYAQQCGTPICDGLVGATTNDVCPLCTPGTWYWQNCVESLTNSYCSQSVNNCSCQRVDQSTSKCNPPN
jgi:hypothetical protein